MSGAGKATRLSKVAREFNVGITTIVEFLDSKGVSIDSKPNAKIEADVYQILVGEFQSDKSKKEASSLKGLERGVKRETITLDESEATERSRKEEPEEIIIKNMENSAPAAAPEPVAEEKSDKGPSVVGKIDLDSLNLKTRPSKKAEPKKEEAPKAEPKKEEVKAAPVAPEAKAETPAPAKKDDAPKATETPAAPATPETPAAPATPDAPKGPGHIDTKVTKLDGPKVLGKIELPVDRRAQKKKQPVGSSSGSIDNDQKKKRKRIGSGKVDNNRSGGGGVGRPQRGKPGGKGKKKEPKPELTDAQIQNQIKETLARLSGGGKSKGSKHRRAKRDEIRQASDDLAEQAELEKKILKVTEFVTANELASMMGVGVTEVISACMSLGLFVSINQRLDAETLSIVAEEFGFETEFISAEVQESIEEEVDSEEDLIERPPIVTVMGHVDHGKTSLLDYIRKENVIAGEAGGITQHIGAYNVTLDSGKTISFLDTPGHEAFTAMRARGAQVTDLAIIVVAADDNVMPQTKEAINHAQAAGVPMIFAINKIDKEGANPDKIREELSQMNILLEDWGGKFQAQEISAKHGTNVNELLEKVCLEAEMLELKANPNKRAVGNVIESSLDKGRGYVTTILVQSGTLKKGDMILAGSHYGRVKIMHNERGQLVEEAGPSMPVSILGLNGAPSAGEKFNVMEDEREVKAISTKRETLQREQGLRTQKHITLDEIGRRLAIGDFQELNVIVKGDVDGSIEALSDSILKLSTESIQVNVIHKSVGAISETDVLLASASDAIIVGFQVRPSAGARRLAEKEGIDIRMYSIIYAAIEELKDAMQGMLAPKFEEKIVCNIEIRETFKISKVGTIAGCFVLDGKVTRNTMVRIIRDGVVTYTGKLGSLKRFKDDVKEVGKGYECGLNIENFNDIKVGDIVEGYEQIEVAQKL